MEDCVNSGSGEVMLESGVFADTNYNCNHGFNNFTNNSYVIECYANQTYVPKHECTRGHRNVFAQQKQRSQLK